MMTSTELDGALNPTGLFPHRRRRPLRSQTYNMLISLKSCCDSLQASAHHRAQGEEGCLELDSASLKESSVVDEAKGTDASKDVSLLDYGGISNLGMEELVVIDGVTHVENHSTLSPGRDHCESVNTFTCMEDIVDAVRSVFFDDEISTVNAVNFPEGVEHELQLKQRELEELIFSPQNIDLSIADDGVEEGGILGDDGEIDFCLEILSLEEEKSDDLLVSKDNVENGNDGDGQEGKVKMKTSLLLNKVEGGNNVRNMERSTREEQNVGEKRFRDYGSSNYEDLDGGMVTEQVRGDKESHHSVISAENFAQRRQITYEDIIDKNGPATDPMEVSNEKKRKRGPLSEERKAEKKRKDRIKRAEKNKQLGVKRLKLETVVKPKKVVYCRHYMDGRCHYGEKCNFSHDTTPLTKSTACSFLARHSCMKGDDCPFDHDLSKYPCDNFVSKGSCSRGADCLFKHEVSNINDPSLTSKHSNPELKSQLPMGGLNSKNHVSNEEVASQHMHTKLSPLNHHYSTGKLSENQLSKNPIPRGISFISQMKSPITNASKHEEAAPELKLSSNSAVSNQLDSIKKSDDTLEKEPLRVPRGINFLSFGKYPFGISASKEKGTVGIPAESVNNQEKRNASDGLVSSISTPNSTSASGSHTLNPFSVQGSAGNGVRSSTSAPGSHTLNPFAGNGVRSSSSSKAPIVFNTLTSAQVLRFSLP